MPNVSIRVLRVSVDSVVVVPEGRVGCVSRVVQDHWVLPPKPLRMYFRLHFGWRTQWYLSIFEFRSLIRRLLWSSHRDVPSLTHQRIALWFFVFVLASLVVHVHLIVVLLLVGKLFLCLVVCRSCSHGLSSSDRFIYERFVSNFCCSSPPESSRCTSCRIQRSQPIIVSAWLSSYSIVVVLWPRRFLKNIDMSRWSRSSNNVFLHLRWTRTWWPFSSRQWSLSVRWIGPTWTVFGLLVLMWYTTPICFGGAIFSGSILCIGFT